MDLHWMNHYFILKYSIIKIKDIFFVRKKRRKKNDLVGEGAFAGRILPNRRVPVHDVRSLRQSAHRHSTQLPPLHPPTHLFHRLCSCPLLPLLLNIPHPLLTSPSTNFLPTSLIYMFCSIYLLFPQQTLLIPVYTLPCLIFCLTNLIPLSSGLISQNRYV